MGIKGLRKLLEHNAPKSMKERKLDNYFRRIIAVDASISIYQFLTAMNPLQNDNGEETSHLVGMLRRTAKFLEAGIEPVYVFDGTPPDMKKQEIAKRNARREDAKKELLDLTGAVEDGDKDKGKDAEELRKRTVKVTSTHYNGCKRLLQLMGVPVIQAPSEAEAQCSHLCKDGKVYAVASEDSDSLTFGAPRVLMNFKGSNEELVKEFDCARVLEELKLTMDQFIDLCILCGCDYCGGIEGIEGQEALNLIRQHGSIESILDNKDSSYQCPDNWLYKEAWRLFKEPNVNLNVPAQQLQWTKHDEEGLIQFLVKENDFSEDRVNNAIKNIVRGRSKPLQRIDDIFMPKRKEASEKDTEAASNKKTKA